MISSFVTDLKWVLLEFLFLFTEEMHTLISWFRILIEYPQYNQAADWMSRNLLCWMSDPWNVLYRRGDVCMLSRVWLFVTPWIAARQAPLSTGFSRQEYWCGLPFPPPGREAGLPQIPSGQNQVESQHPRSFARGRSSEVLVWHILLFSSVSIGPDLYTLLTGLPQWRSG